MCEKNLVAELLAVAATLHGEGYPFHIDSRPNQGGPVLDICGPEGVVLQVGLSAELSIVDNPPDQDFAVFRRISWVFDERTVTAPAGGLLGVVRQRLAEPVTTPREQVIGWLCSNAERLGITVPDYQPDCERSGLICQFYPAWLPEQPIIMLAIDLCGDSPRLVVIGAGGGEAVGEPVTGALNTALETLVRRGRRIVQRYGEILADPESVIEAADLGAIANAMSA